MIPAKKPLSPEEWQAVKTVLATVLETDPSERLTTLDRLCGQDTALRTTVESFLAHESKAGDALDSAVFPGAELRQHITGTPQEPAPPPTRIGPYDILREIGRGGMGVVYLGERADGEYRKRVAIKLITGRGPSSAALEARFRRERQILAQLEHPGIAHLLDGGATPEGQPYFVMEYIEGPPLLAWCDQHKLSVSSRLSLFTAVCEAVSYAHQKLIVHRDLKPGNILVTPGGTPKLLDFGLARALDPDSESADNTQAGPPLMTIAYASPEQVRGEPYNVSSDVYSLGVILYELLTAHRPYGGPTTTLMEMMRIICEEPPTLPSQAGFTPAEALARGATPDRLIRRLKGDLEKILLKALSKDAHLRYATVDDFAADVRRHLSGLPVAARPATFFYRAGKFIRRHHIAILTAVIAVALILGFAGLSWWEARRAERRFNQVRSLAHSVMFDLHDAIEKLPGSIAARELLIRRALEYLEILSQESSRDPKLALEVANGYARVGDVQGRLGDTNLGNVPKAIESYRKAEQIVSRLLANSPNDESLRREYSRINQGLASLYEQGGNFAAAGQLADKNVAVAEAAARAHPDDPAVVRSLAVALWTRADLLTDERQYDQSIKIRQRILSLIEHVSELKGHNADSQHSVALSHKKLGALYGITKRYADAHQEYEKARVIDEQLLASSPTSASRLDLSYDYGDIGWVALQTKDFSKALDSYRRALALREQAAASDPNDYRAATAVASMTERIAGVLREMGDLPAALEQKQLSLSQWKELAERPGAAWGVIRDLADTHKELADIYVDIGANPAKRRASFASAAAEYAQARDLYVSLKNRGMLPKSHEKTLDEYAALAKKYSQ